VKHKIHCRNLCKPSEEFLLATDNFRKYCVTRVRVSMISFASTDTALEYVETCNLCPFVGFSADTNYDDVTANVGKPMQFQIYASMTNV
jgi:hypothetical protein